MGKFFSMVSYRRTYHARQVVILLKFSNRKIAINGDGGQSNESVNIKILYEFLFFICPYFKFQFSASLPESSFVVYLMKNNIIIERTTSKMNQDIIMKNCATVICTMYEARVRIYIDMRARVSAFFCTTLILLSFLAIRLKITFLHNRRKKKKNTKFTPYV